MMLYLRERGTLYPVQRWKWNHAYPVGTHTHKCYRIKFPD